MRALGHVLIAAGATVSLYGLMGLFFGYTTALSVGVAVMATGFVLPRVVRTR